jgi:hypothetical protein
MRQALSVRPYQPLRKDEVVFGFGRGAAVGVAA